MSYIISATNQHHHINILKFNRYPFFNNSFRSANNKLFDYSLNSTYTDEFTILFIKYIEQCFTKKDLKNVKIQMLVGLLIEFDFHQIYTE